MNRGKAAYIYREKSQGRGANGAKSRGKARHGENGTESHGRGGFKKRRVMEKSPTIEESSDI